MGQKQKQDSKKGKPSSAGKRKGKIEEYFLSPRRMERKIRRILRHNGVKAARSWADKHTATSILRRILTPEFERTLERREHQSKERAVAALERRWARRCQRKSELANLRAPNPAYM